VDHVPPKPDKTRSSRPAGGPSASAASGLFGDDDEDIFAPVASKPLAADRASKKGLCRCVFCPVFVVCENTQVKPLTLLMIQYRVYMM